MTSMGNWAEGETSGSAPVNDCLGEKVPQSDTTRTPAEVERRSVWGDARLNWG
jgi:hypothetical protein